MSEVNPLVTRNEEKIRLMTSRGELQMSKQTEEHLRSLESYGAGLNADQHAVKRKETSQKIIEEQTLIMERYHQLHPAEVDQTAPGTPVQTVRPAEVTWKEKRQRKRETEEVHTKHGLTTCDYRTLRAVNSLKEEQIGKSNSMSKAKGELNNPNESGQIRVAAFLTKPVMLDKHGQPLTEKDAEAQVYNDKMYDAFKQVDFSQAGTPQQLDTFRPYFDRMINEILNFNFTPQMNTDDYVLSHAREIKYITLLITNLDDMYTKFPFFLDYLNEMEPQKKKVLDSIQESCAKISTVFYARFCALGVEYNNSTYLDPEGVPIWTRILREHEHNQLYEKAIKAVNDTKADVLASQYRDEETANQPVMKQKLKAETGIDFTGFVTDASYNTLTDVKRWIAGNPDKYDANSAIVDRQYQKLFKALDSLGDIVLQMNTLQRAIDAIKTKYPGDDDIADYEQEDRQSLLNLMARRDALDAGELSVMKKYATGVQDYLEHILTEKELSESGQLYMEQDRIEQQREQSDN